MSTEKRDHMGSKLSNTFVCKLARSSGISEEIMVEADLFDNEEGITSIKGEGIVYTYYDLSGEFVKYRVGYKTPIILDNGKKIKYYELPGIECGPYFIQKDLIKILNPKLPLYITEGEKKLLSLKTLISDSPVVAFPGAHNWQIKESGGKLSKVWDEMPVQGRKIILIPDTDMFLNSMVYLGYRRFIRALIEKGAIVELIDLRNGE